MNFQFGSITNSAPAATANSGPNSAPGRWTDYFTGRTYRGPSVQTVSSDLSTMPVFMRAGGIVPMRTDDVTNDVQNPLTKLTLNVAEGGDGSYSLYEDHGTTTNPSHSAQTPVRYTASAHTVTVTAPRALSVHAPTVIAYRPR